MGGFGSVAAESEGLDLREEDCVLGAGGGLGEEGECEEDGVGEMHIGRCLPWQPLGSVRDG